jgi:hypothetical protein
MDDHTRRFFIDHDELTYNYPSGHWYTVKCAEIAESPERPAGLKYALVFFDSEGHCLVRFDNSHAVSVKGKANPVAYDHWHRFTAPEELVPYEFTDVETLLSDFFEAIERYLPSESRISS